MVFSSGMGFAGVCLYLTLAHAPSTRTPQTLAEAEDELTSFTEECSLFSPRIDRWK